MNRSFFVKTFLVFFLMVGFAVSVIGLVVTNRSRQTALESIENTNKIMLSGYLSQIDQRLMTMNNLAMQIIGFDETTTLLKNPRRIDDHMLMKQIIDKNAALVMTTPLIDAIYLFNSEQDYVLSAYNSGGVKYTKANFPYQYILEGLPEGETYGFRVPSEGVLRTDMRTIPFIRRFNMIADTRDIYVIAMLYADTLFQDLRHDTPDQRGFAVIDAQNNLLFIEEHTDLFDTYRALEPSERDADSRLLNDSRQVPFLLCREVSDFSGWELLSAQPYEQLMQLTKARTSYIAWLAALTLLAAAALSYLFFSYLYRPFYQLLNRLESPANRRVGRLRYNEFQVLDSAISSMYNRNYELLANFKAASELYRKYSLQSLLHAGSEEDVTNLAALFREELPLPFFMLAVHEREAAPNDEGILYTLPDTLLDETGVGCLVSHESDYRDVFLLNMSSADDAFAEKLRISLAAYTRDGLSEPLLAVSEPFSAFERIPQVYQRLSAELEQMAASRSSAAEGHEQALLIAHFTSKLNEQIIGGDAEQALQIFAAFFDELRAGGAGTAALTQACYAVYVGVVQTLQEQHVVRRITDLPHIAFSEETVWGNDSTEPLRARMDAFISACTRLVALSKSESKSRVVCRVMEFIQQNYASDISLDAIARHVYLNPKYLSSFFKDEVGITVYEYLTSLRVSAGKELLINTTMQVNDIGAKVGYNSAQSFIRAFKSCYAVTPSAFRRNYHIQED